MVTRSTRRFLIGLYTTAIAVVVGFTLWGWLGDCAKGEIDGQCGMSTAFGLGLGVVGAFIILALGHWLPALGRTARRPSRSSARKHLH